VGLGWSWRGHQGSQEDHGSLRTKWVSKARREVGLELP
jgi:hypothetical protein